jgi:tetratricopeptide (TPR) repeat protein
MNSQDKIRDISAEILLREGRQYQDHQSFRKALESYQRAAALEPRYEPVHFSMGVVLAKMGRWSEAIAAYREAIRLLPEDTEAHLNLGFVYYELGLDEQAQDSFARARELGGLAKPAAKMRF